MSEYFTVETEPTADPNILEIITNHTLTTDGEEIYTSPAEGEVGTPLAQMLFLGVDGIRALRIDDDTLFITRAPDVTWEQIVDDVRDALRDFFL